MNDKPQKVRKAWKSYMDKYYQVDMKNKGLFGTDKTLIAEEVKLREVQKNNIDIYTEVHPTFNGSEMHVFVAIAEDSFLNERNAPIASQNTEYIISEFAKDFHAKLYQRKANKVSERITNLEVDSNELMTERLKIRDELKENLNQLQELNLENQDLRKEISELQDKYDKVELMLSRQKELLEDLELMSENLSEKR